MSANPVDGLPLNDVEIRVLGALIEKELTTPEYYPLSLNALANACNQINNRDPVMTLGENQVLRAVESLRDKRLAYVFSGAVSRVVKYGHKTGEILHLTPSEVAVICVLLLRGPQTVGEIRGRTARMHEFKDLAEAQTGLNALASRPEPLVVCLPRQAGTKEPRYAHLLAGEVSATPPARVTPDAAESTSAAAPQQGKLEDQVAELRREMAELRQQFAEFRKQFE